MLNPLKEIDWRPDRQARRRFGRSLMIGFPIVAVGMAILTRLAADQWKPGFLWLGAMGFAVGFFSWAFPAIARPFYLVWYGLGGAVGFVMGNTLLSLTYYLLLTPIGLALRLCGRAPLKKGFDKQRASYWAEAPRSQDPQRYYRQF